MLVKDETKATAHAMPDEVCGFTEILDDTLKKILFSQSHERELFPITYDPQSKPYGAIKATNSVFELSCHPLEGIFDFEKRPSSSRSDISKDLNRLIEGGPESLGDREKW